MRSNTLLFQAKATILASGQGVWASINSGTWVRFFNHYCSCVATRPCAWGRAKLGYHVRQYKVPVVFPVFMDSQISFEICMKMFFLLFSLLFAFCYYYLSLRTVVCNTRKHQITCISQGTSHSVVMFTLYSMQAVTNVPETTRYTCLTCTLHVILWYVYTHTPLGRRHIPCTCSVASRARR